VLAGCRERCLDLGESRNDIAFSHVRKGADELVPAKADDEVDGPELRSQRLDKLQQHPVPRGVSTRVVDGFELIDVKEPEHQGLTCAPRSVYHSFQFGDSRTTLVDAGETIEGGAFPVPRRRPTVRGGMGPLGGADATVDKCGASINLGSAALMGTSSPILRRSPPVCSSLAPGLTRPDERVSGEPRSDRRLEFLPSSISGVSGQVAFVAGLITLVGGMISSVGRGVAHLSGFVSYLTSLISRVGGLISLVGGPVPLIAHLVALIARTLSLSPGTIPLIGDTVALIASLVPLIADLVALVSEFVSVVSGTRSATVRTIPTQFDVCSSAIHIFAPLFDMVPLLVRPPAARAGLQTFVAGQVALLFRQITLLCG
jgi:hypothetical protein